MKASNTVLEYEARLIDAQRKSDVNELNELLHDDLVFTIPNGQIITKHTDLDSHKSGDMAVSSSIILDQTVKLIEDIAIVITTIELKCQYKNQPIDGKFVYNRVWKQFGKPWKLIAGSAVQVQ